MASAISPQDTAGGWGGARVWRAEVTRTGATVGSIIHCLRLVFGRNSGMTKQALLAEILRLPPAERIVLLGEAWDSIAARPEDVPVPEWHIEELERRMANPDPQFLTWDEVRTRLGSAGE